VGNLDNLMRLTELRPRFIRYDVGGTRGFVDNLADAQGILFYCPTCKEDGFKHNISLPFRERGVPSAVNGGHQWKVAGTDFSDLTLTPSVNAAGGSCRWHGYVTNGDVTCLA